MPSLSQVMDESWLFIRRESALLLPLAFATLWLGNVAVTLIFEWLSQHQGQQAVVVPLTLLLVVMALWAMVGQLAITAMALHPGMTVAEGIRQAIRRLARVIAARLMVGIALALLALPLLPKLAALSQGGISAGSLTSLEIIWMLGWLAIALWIEARLLLLYPLLMRERLRAIPALREAFRLTAPHTRLVVEVMLLGVAVNVVRNAASLFVLGSAFIALGTLIGEPQTAHLLDIMSQAAILTLFMMVASVFIARLYGALTQSQAAPA